MRDSSWLADSVNDPDAFIKLWDVWYAGKLLSGDQGFFHTDMLFHPAGLDLTYHTFNLPHMLVTYALIPLTGSLIAAFNLTAILFTIATAYSGYLLIRYLLDLTPRPPLQTERGSSAPLPEFGEGQGVGFEPITKNYEPKTALPAFYGGCVFGFSQWVVHNFRHPDLSLLVTFALGMLLFIRACRKLSLRTGIGAGILLGITAYIGMYIVVVMGIFMAAITLIHLPKQARRFRYWLMLVLCGITAVLIAAPRILPMVRGNLTFVLEDKYTTYHQWESVDLVNYFVPANHPVWGKAFELPNAAKRYHMFYLGWIPLALILMGLVRRRFRREVLFWFALLVFFMLLSMGTILNINGTGYPDFPMPKTLLDALPVIFEAFGRPDNFQIGVVLPLAIAAAFGLKTILDIVGAQHAAPSNNEKHNAERQRNRDTEENNLTPQPPLQTERGSKTPLPEFEEGKEAGFVLGTQNSELRTFNSLLIARCSLLILLVSLTLFELSVGAYPGRDVNAGVSPFYRKLAAETENFALIQLPMGRNPAKPYLFYQTIHGKPIVEGLASRTPAGAYDFINANTLLSAWTRLQPLDCASDLSDALDALIAADFRYVVIQKNLRSTDVFLSYFPGVTPVYEDTGIGVYQVVDVRAAGC